MKGSRVPDSCYDGFNNKTKSSHKDRPKCELGTTHEGGTGKCRTVESINL